MRRLPFLTVLFTLSAFAEPAVISVFEAKVHENPDESAPVIHTFAENAQVSVSEEAQQGWRRVRLPSGATGWIQEKNLRIGAATAPPPSDAPRASSTPPAEPKPKIYVKDLPHLAELTKPDAVVFPKAEALAARHTQGQVAYWAGGIGAVGLGAAAVIVFLSPADPGTPEFRQNNETFTGLLIGAIVIGGLGGGLGWLLSPKREDLIDVINEWNTRHTAEQFELQQLPPKS